MGGCSQYRGKVASFESPWVQRSRRVKSTPADSSDSSSVSRSRKAGTKIVHGRVRLRAGRSANAPIPHTVAASFLEVRYVPRVDVHLCQVCVSVAKGVPAACCCCLCHQISTHTSLLWAVDLVGVVAFESRNTGKVFRKRFAVLCELQARGHVHAKTPTTAWYFRVVIVYTLPSSKARNDDARKSGSARKVGARKYANLICHNFEEAHWRSFRCIKSQSTPDAA